MVCILDKSPSVIVKKTESRITSLHNICTCDIHSEVLRCEASRHLTCIEVARGSIPTNDTSTGPKGLYRRLRHVKACSKVPNWEV